MAGPNRLKLGGLVEGMWKNVLTKECLGSVKLHHDQVGGPQVPLLGHGDDCTDVAAAAATGGDILQAADFCQQVHDESGLSGGP